MATRRSAATENIKIIAYLEKDIDIINQTRKSTYRDEIRLFIHKYLKNRKIKMLINIEI